MKSFTAGVILIGCLVTLVVHGYQFGHSNHSVYLIDALRQVDPTLLARDWFYTQTLQYHSLFGSITAVLLKLGTLPSAFLAIYLLLIVGLHIAWRDLVLVAGGDDRTYLLSVILYYLSAGGIGLGTYQFLQDSAVLASNLANVAMLCGLAAYIRGKWFGASAAFALAGALHANHAAVALILWGIFAAAEYRAIIARWTQPRFWAASALLATGCLLNLVPAAMATLEHPTLMPLSEFVDIYVKLRHPHHYDPSSWPWAQWLAFCIWIVPAALAARLLITRSAHDRPAARLLIALASILALQVIALIFAGAVYVSQTLIQLSLYRFSIFAHLMMVILSATLLIRFNCIAWALPVCMAIALAATMASPFAEVATQRLAPLLVLLILAAIPAALTRLAKRKWSLELAALALCGGLIAGFDRFTGLTRPLSNLDPDYLALCRWCSDDRNTPRDAIVLTPPTDEDFRWNARRAIVVNWKSVPQLAAELPEWCQRMSASLGWPNLDPIPRQSYPAAIHAMRRRYDELPPEQYLATARLYRADYFLATRDLGPEFEPLRVSPIFGRYRLYAASR